MLIPEPKLTVLVPAHDEQERIGRTLDSIWRQTRQPTRVIVVCDNCTDATERLARAHGADTFLTVANTEKKAGALNQALAHVLPELQSDDYVLAMDADIILGPHFIANAYAHFARDGPTLGAVSGNHDIMPYATVLEFMQSMEMERDRRYMGRKQGKAGCMFGGGTVFRVGALRAVQSAYGTIYVASSMAEDWMLTFALKHQRYKLLKPQNCKITTDPEPTWRKLWRQRQRWSHGYIEAIGRFGLTKHTAIPWFGMVLWGLSLTIWSCWVMMMIVLVIQGMPFHLQIWVLGITVLLAVNKVWTVRRLGPDAMMLAATMIPELVYSWWLQFATMAGVHKYLTGADGQW